jgi:thioredoxin 1
MHAEYRAIANAGFIVQLDYAVLNPQEQLMKERPDLTAEDLTRARDIIAGCDCGFSQSWDWLRLHPTNQWAKLEAFAQGAALASDDLW